MTTMLSMAAPRRHGREGFTTLRHIRRRTADRFLKRVRLDRAADDAVNQRWGAFGEIGTSMVMVGESAEASSEIRPAAYHLYVEDVDATYQRALAAGATSLGEPADRPYGERSGFVQDVMGNNWYIGRPLNGPAVPEGLRTVTPYLHPKGAPAYIDFLKQAFGAVEDARHLGPEGRVMHAQVRIGNAVIELGDPDPAESQPRTFYLYVDDADALRIHVGLLGPGPCRHGSDDLVDRHPEARRPIELHHLVSRGPRSKTWRRSRQRGQRGNVPVSHLRRYAISPLRL
jgi:uncharacterized glyoxalase superfamily protein PhnB